MRRAEWIALVVVASTAAILALAIVPSIPGRTKFEFANPHNAAFIPGGERCGPAAAERRGLTTQEENRCAEAREEYRQRTDDLIQQTRAANAAAAQAVIAGQSLWMSYFQTIGGLLTLAAAAAAAWFAREAARHAASGASAAENALTETQEANRIAREAVDRAWLTIEVSPNSRLYYADPATLIMGVRILVQNMGNRPALRASIAIKFVTVMRAWEAQRALAAECRADSSRMQYLGDVFAGHPIERSDLGVTGDGLVDRINHPDGGHLRNQLSIVGCLQYYLPNSLEPHQTSFAYDTGVIAGQRITREFSVPPESIRLQKAIGGNPEMD